MSPRAIRLLRVLAEAGGATVSRGDLLDRIWPDVIVGDESLTQVVSEVRRRLSNRGLIATIPRGGYRLTVPVFGLAAEQASPDGPAPDGLTLDAYTLCIEATACFARGAEGSSKSFVDLAARAVAMAPDFALARAIHAMALFKRHIYWSEGAMLLEAVLEEAEAALAIDPNQALAHLISAAAQVAAGMTERGIAALERALSHGRGDAALHLDASILVLSLGNRRAAAALAVRSAQLDQDQFRGDLTAARLLLPFDPAQARIHAERALKKVRDELSVDPHSMRALYALGPLLALLGDHRAARTALEGVAHHDSPLEYYRAMGFAQIGDVAAALERIDFLAMRGWRHACILDKDEGFAPLLPDRGFQKLHGELMAA